MIRLSGMRAFPPRLPDQPIFYPVLTEDYAIKIARDWNVPCKRHRIRQRVSRSGIEKEAFSASYEMLQEAGGRDHLEYLRVPAAKLSMRSTLRSSAKSQVTSEFHSIRINGAALDGRVRFTWTEEGPADVEIVDYH